MSVASTDGRGARAALTAAGRRTNLSLLARLLRWLESMQRRSIASVSRLGLALLAAVTVQCHRPVSDRLPAPPQAGVFSPMPPPSSVGRALTRASASGRELIARGVVDDLAEGAFERIAARFDERLRARLTASSLGETWEQVQLGAGHYVRQASVRLERRDGYDVFFIRTLFARAELETLVALDAQARITGLAIRPLPSSGTPETPGYVDRSRFTEREIRVPDPSHFCGSGTCGLPGTLSLPKGTGPFPAVVLLHGSGPQDRDETLGELRPFRDIAWGLASSGIGVLRYDKRTHFLRGRLSAAQVEALTVQEEFVQDALGAIQLLRSLPEVNAARLFVVGHSQGGAVLPRLAASDPALCGFVSLAGPLRPLEDIVLEQVRFLSRLDGNEDTREAADLRLLEAQAARVKTLTDAEPVAARDLPLGIPKAYWLDLARNPPIAALAKEKRPFLVLQGERDYQVTLADFALWKSALGASPAARFKSYPALNHLFVAGEGPITPSEYLRAGNVHAEVIDDVAEFIRASCAGQRLSSTARTLERSPQN